jgi:amino acid transporter
MKRLFVGRPLATQEQEHQRISKVIALAVFSSDAISSTAYAVEEILFVTAVAATSSLQKGLTVLVPIAIAVCILLAIVVTSYRQTIFAYPSGGGSYVVSRENLGEYPALLAGASLLVDYILTVAVSISAGVAAIISIPALSGLVHLRVVLALILVLLITLANLRGVKESGRIFAIPTYIYIVVLALLVVVGLSQVFFFHNIKPVPFDPQQFEGAAAAGGTLGLFLILKGFSSGAVALSGVEAISNGVPAFRRPESKNAATTLMWMGFTLGSLFLGVSILAHHLRPYPSHDQTVFSQMGLAVFHNGPLYLILQFATAAILTLAANTAYADFPRLSSIIAADGYLPRQFANRGDRLVFSNGIVFLALAASALLIAFGGLTNALIPLYAVGVFTSFTLSQAGMVIHHLKERERGWRRSMVINGVGSVATLVVTVIVAATKFTSGAWIPLVVVPLIIFVFVRIKRHYDKVGRALAISPDEVRPERHNHTVVVLVGRLHRGVVKALTYARSLNPNHLVAVFVAYDEEAADEFQREWDRFGFKTSLEIVHSPYRDLVDPVEDYLDELDQRWQNDTITVIIPEFVVAHWYENILHNQSALQLKLAMLGRENTVVTSVPYHVHRAPDGAGAHPPATQQPT